MRLWHGYPIGDDAHPERPWWLQHLGGWFRRGWFVTAQGSLPALAWRTDRLEVTAIVDSGGGSGLLHDGVERLLARIDAEHPLPAPAPMVGQVWVWPSGIARTLTQMQLRDTEHYHYTPGVDWLIGFSGLELRGYANPASNVAHAWPPPGAVLVAGPTQWGRDCQWAPMDAEETP